MVLLVPFLRSPHEGGVALARPTDWYVLDLDADPTPGDPYGIRDLARRFGGFAADVESATRRVRGLSGNEAIASWVGDAGDAYREEIGGFPDDLDKLSRSYRMASDALNTYARDLDGAQAEADRALVQGRDARARLGTAQNSLTAARSSEQQTNRALTQVRAPVPAGSSAPPPPDPTQVAAAVRDHNAATTRLTQAQAQVNSAQGEVDAARRLALAAKGLRETAEETARHSLDAASHAGIRNKGFWGHLGDALAKGWKVLVIVCKVVVVVLAVVALFVGGPLVWGLLLAASLILLADTLNQYRQGKASLLDVGLAALACIPGGRLAAEGGELVRLTSAGRALLRPGESLANAARGLRSLPGFGRTVMGKLKPEVLALVAKGDWKTLVAERASTLLAQEGGRVNSVADAVRPHLDRLGESWAGLTRQERNREIRTIYSDVRDAMGAPTNINVHPTPLSEGNFGELTFKPNGQPSGLRINNASTSLDDTVSTIVHETRHSYQIGEAGRVEQAGVTSATNSADADALLWSQNKPPGNYIGAGQNHAAYLRQPVELDSFGFESAVGQQLGRSWPIDMTQGAG